MQQENPVSRQELRAQRTTKTCTKCLKTKPLGKFGKSARARDGLQTQCKICRAAYSREYYAAHKEQCRKHGREYAAAHKEEKDIYNRQYYAEHKEEQAICARRRHMRTYGISLTDYDEMLGAQDYTCAICGTTPEENGRRLSVDHDHETNKVRALLCSNCNAALGNLQDNPELCRLAMLYLQHHKEQPE